MRLCFCRKPVFGTDKITREGYCKSHQYMRTDLDRRPIAVKAMEKASAETRFGRLVVDETKSNSRIVSSGAVLERWFKERRKELTGKCKHCGGKTVDLEEINQDYDPEVYRNKKDFYKHCIAHILPKAYFPSVATHPLNWIELCFWNNSCHTNLDNLSLDITELNCFNEVIEKFVAIYPNIDAKERKRIPATLMNYVQIDL